MTVLTKPKHVAILLKQSNFSNYSVVMSDCLSMFISPRLTIYRAVHLTNCYLSRYVETFRKCLPTFRMVAFPSPSRSVSPRRVHITTAEILRLSSVTPPPMSQTVTLSLTTIRPAASSVLLGASPYRMFSQTLYCPQ